MTSACEEGFAFALDDLAGLCTHGPDPAPEGVDAAAAETAPVSDTQASSAAPLVCDGDGVSGFRAKAIYAYAAGTADRSAEYAASFEVWAAETQREVALSTVEHDATATPLHYRFEHTPVASNGTCDLALDVLELSAEAANDFGAMISELKALGYDETSRNYMVWMDASRYCGIGTLYADSRPDPTLNTNNSGVAASYSRADAGCWDYAETHELLHNIGAVQNDAPNSTGGYHCNDDRDVMCYHDGGSTAATFVDANCQDARFEELLDCNGDDCFHPSPASDSYLATHWNTADSAWLFTAPLSGGTGGDGTTGDGGGGGGDTTVTWTVELVDATNTVLGSATGSGVVTFSVPDAPAGSYSVRVRDGKGGYTLTVEHGCAGRSRTSPPRTAWGARTCHVSSAGRPGCGTGRTRRSRRARRPPGGLKRSGRCAEHRGHALPADQGRLCAHERHPSCWPPRWPSPG